MVHVYSTEEQELKYRKIKIRVEGERKQLVESIRPLLVVNMFLVKDSP